MAEECGAGQRLMKHLRRPQMMAFPNIYDLYRRGLPAVGKKTSRYLKWVTYRCKKSHTAALFTFECISSFSVIKAKNYSSLSR